MYVHTERRRTQIGELETENGICSRYYILEFLNQKESYRNKWMLQ
jgi:hypothetical protein